MNKVFDISRFWLLLKLELYRSRKMLIMTTVITIGMLFFLDLLLSNLIEESKLTHDHQGSYAFTMMVGGFILSSLAFNDFGNSLKRIHYLMVPVSALEKFLCMWILTSIGWILYYTIVFSIYSLLANYVGHLMFRFISFQTFEPLSGFTITIMKYYFATQGIFMAGAALFRGYVFPKVIFTLVLFVFLCVIIAHFFLSDVSNPEVDVCISDTDILTRMSVYKVWLVATWLFWWVLAPVSWVVTYLGLKEQEV